MMKVLVTGSTGFVGSNLIPYLAAKQSYKVYLLNRSGRMIEYPISGYFLWDQFEDIANHRFDAIIHLAGKAHDTKGSTKEAQYTSVNYGLTKKIFGFFLTSNSTKFIYLSSVKAVADKVIGSLDEEALPEPGTAYGSSKLMAEEYIQGSDLALDQRYYILRPCMVHGPENKGNLNLLFKMVKNGLPYPLAAFDNQRSFLSIENLLFIIDSLVIGSADSGIYHLADDEPLSTNEVVALMARSLNKLRYKPWPINKSLIRFIARFGDFLPLPINSERLKKLTESYLVNNSKIKKSLNKKLPVSSKEGLLRTFDHFL